jgi:Family of unknown function (DUF5996)
LTVAGGVTPTLPALPLEEWEPTKDTVHLYVQIVGKLRLACAPPRNHWWHVPLYLDVRGLSTRPMRHNGVSFQIDFDFIDHRLVVCTERGESESFRLRDGLSVADFHGRLFELLEGLGLTVEIHGEPFGVPATMPFARDREHSSYDPDAVARYWRALLWIGDVFEEFAGWFCGKTSPVHLFWHSFDLAVTRFSGRRAPERSGVDPVTREAYTHEVISFGFWAGDAQRRAPVFYSYTAPEPPALAEHPLRPAGAFWSPSNGSHLALLWYEEVRTAVQERVRLLDFLESAYQAGAVAAGWDLRELSSSWCPAERLPASGSAGP